MILAGHPGKSEADYRAAGVDRFIYMRCDVLDALWSLLRAEEAQHEQDPKLRGNALRSERLPSLICNNGTMMRNMRRSSRSRT